MEIRKPLTKSGIGILIQNADAAVFSKERIETLLSENHFIVLKELDWTTNELTEFLGQFGELVKNERREHETQLALDGTRVKTEVIRGNGRLPLHRDGLLMNAVVKYVGIMCLDNRVTKGGRTYLSDSTSAWQEFPENIKNALTKNGIEGTPYDTTYYLKQEDTWHPFPGVWQYSGKSSLNGALNYRKSERASWGIRIPNIDDETSEQYFIQMEEILENDKYTYYHNWSKGDLILFDNRTVMHGREAFEGERSLVQMQVKE